ncbi:hypothetical protein [Paractinoplanes brasiliensis]|uniref:Ribosomally synthesized peptide with SipW-like signal peptide n=1 Tax=Paractinoplanes brasiliensis TaxID=52695 RepID=A0A4R6JYH6_9ACTN|nr:hypothetical protein [Actinoplanes brasiliensis]TDO40316.1 hypothetical protein C8E87_4028 [Actinoplanes brasiliensis]GID25382.1 hypothetical protein Abr02nite_03650 [Actinoplanes brasiliensis]
MRKMTKRSAIVTGVAVAALGIGATAWAASWLVTGSGSGTASAAKIEKLEATAKVNGNVFPGAKTTITLTVNNKNEFPVQIDPTSFVPKPVKVTPAGAEATTCANNLKPSAITDLKIIKGDGKVPAKSKAEVTADLLIGDLPQECAGKSFELDYDFSGTSAA